MRVITREQWGPDQGLLTGGTWREIVGPRAGAECRGLYDLQFDEDGETTWVERLEDTGPGPQDTYLRQETSVEVNEALQKVRKRIGEMGWDILQERLTQDQPRTLEELGRRWGVSRERVRQVELRTKSFLERYLSAFNQDEEAALLSEEQDAA